MNKTLRILKIIGISIMSILALAGIVSLIIVTGGKNEQIKKLFTKLTDNYKKEIEKLNTDNVKIDEAWEALSARERSIINVIKLEGKLKIPKEIDMDDYAALLDWFREREVHYIPEDRD